MKNIRHKATLLGAIISGGVAAALVGIGIIAGKHPARTVPPADQSSPDPTPPNDSPPSRKSQIDSAVKLLGATGSLVTIVTAVAALIISLITLHMQLQGQVSAEAAAQEEYAQHVSFWWTLNKDGTSVDLHIQNSNSSPVTTWAAHLPDDAQPVPGTVPLQAKYVPMGAVSLPPSVFIGQIPPCEEVTISSPLARAFGASAAAPLNDAGLLEGDVIITDPAGRTWIRTLSGSLQRASGIDLVITQSSPYEEVPVAWESESTSPVCS